MIFVTDASLLVRSTKVDYCHINSVCLSVCDDSGLSLEIAFWSLWEANRKPIVQIII